MKTKAAPKPQRQPRATPDCCWVEDAPLSAVPCPAVSAAAVRQVHTLYRGLEGRSGRRPAAMLAGMSGSRWAHQEDGSVWFWFTSSRLGFARLLTPRTRVCRCMSVSAVAQGSKGLCLVGGGKWALAPRRCVCGFCLATFFHCCTREKGERGSQTLVFIWAAGATRLGQTPSVWVTRVLSK